MEYQPKITSTSIQTPETNQRLIELAYQLGYEISKNTDNNEDLQPIYAQYQEMINGFFSPNLEGIMRGGVVNIEKQHSKFLCKALEIIDEEIQLMPQHSVEHIGQEYKLSPIVELASHIHSTPQYTIDSDFVLSHLSGR